MNIVPRAPVSDDRQLDRAMANAIRMLSLDAIANAGDGHPGTPLGCAEIATVLFTRQGREELALLRLNLLMVRSAARASRTMKPGTAASVVSSLSFETAP